MDNLQMHWWLFISWMYDSMHFHGLVSYFPTLLFSYIETKMKVPWVRDWDSDPSVII